jgi:hypothetical protein
MSKVSYIVGVAAICCSLYAGVAQAQPYGFTPRQRAIIGDYVFGTLGNRCPSGAKLVNEGKLFTEDSVRCIWSEGSGVTYYSPGAIIPSGVTYTTLPAEIVAQLPPPAKGEVYVMIDNNVYLMTSETNTVVASVMVMDTED